MQKTGQNAPKTWNVKQYHSFFSFAILSSWLLSVTVCMWKLSLHVCWLRSRCVTLFCVLCLANERNDREKDRKQNVLCSHDDKYKNIFILDLSYASAAVTTLLIVKHKRIDDIKYVWMVHFIWLWITTAHSLLWHHGTSTSTSTYMTFLFGLALAWLGFVLFGLVWFPTSAPTKKMLKCGYNDIWCIHI